GHRHRPPAGGQRGADLNDAAPCHAGPPGEVRAGDDVHRGGAGDRHHIRSPVTARRPPCQEAAVFIFEKAPFGSCHASTIGEAEKGSFLAAWFGGTAEGKRDVKIWLSRFDGKAWSKPEVAGQEPGYPCWNPVLFKSRTKTLFLFYKAGRDPM